MTVWQKRILTTDRGSFELFIAGQGEPICVTHYYSAFTERGNYFADMFVDYGQVLLINLKECGNSDKIIHDEELSMTESVRDLEAIRETMGFQRWSFAGHSTGGMLGLVYAMSHSESLINLTVVGAAASSEYMSSPGSIYCRDNPKNPRLREIFSILRSSESSSEEKALASREWVEMSLHHPEKWDEYFAKPSSGRVVQKRLDYYNRHLSQYDIRKDLHLIDTPTLVMCGKHDTQCPVNFTEEIHQWILQSEIYIFKESNHSPHTEEPIQFNEVVRHFIPKNQSQTT